MTLFLNIEVFNILGSDNNVESKIITNIKLKKKLTFTLYKEP